MDIRRRYGEPRRQHIHSFAINYIRTCPPVSGPDQRRSPIRPHSGVRPWAQQDSKARTGANGIHSPSSKRQQHGLQQHPDPISSNRSYFPQLQSSVAYTQRTSRHERTIPIPVTGRDRPADVVFSRARRFDSRQRSGEAGAHGYVKFRYTH